MKDPSLIIVAEAPGISEIDSGSKKKPSTCRGCPLYSTGVGFVHPTMRGCGRPLVGKAGQFLDYRILQSAGIDPKTVLKDNTLRCLLKGVSGEYPTALVKTQAEKMCRQYDLFDRYPNTPIMLCGVHAISQFYQRNTTVGAMNGDVRVVGKRVVGCTYHPSSALRDADLLPLIVQHFANLMYAAKNSLILKPPRVIKGIIPFLHKPKLTNVLRRK